MKRPQKLAVMLVPTPPYEICGLVNRPANVARRRPTAASTRHKVPMNSAGRRRSAPEARSPVNQRSRAVSSFRAW
jgi:hypothetical protein